MVGVKDFDAFLLFTWIGFNISMFVVSVDVVHSYLSTVSEKTKNQLLSS